MADYGKRGVVVWLTSTSESQSGISPSEELANCESPEFIATTSYYLVAMLMNPDQHSDAKLFFVQLDKEGFGLKTAAE